jgi:NADPH:quinone reductase-like Zn-dependent oxidoreductase
MARAITQNKIKPVIDRVFPFDQALDAYQHLPSGNFIGKLVITV